MFTVFAPTYADFDYEKDQRQQIVIAKPPLLCQRVSSASRPTVVILFIHLFGLRRPTYFLDLRRLALDTRPQWPIVGFRRKGNQARRETDR